MRLVFIGLLAGSVLFAGAATAQTPAGPVGPDLDAMQKRLDAAKAAKAAADKKAAEEAKAASDTKAAAEKRAAAEKKAADEASARDVPAKAPDRAAAGDGPADEMAIIPAGQFTMGATLAETKRESVLDAFAGSALPQHEVRIRSFLLAKYAVTRGEFAEFVAATGYSAAGCHVSNGDKFELNAGATWQRPGFDQTDRHPVVCVSPLDAEAYIKWYSQKSGSPYRLPSEAEWEYAARAGTTTARYWGDSSAAQCEYANGADLTAKDKFPDWTVAQCRDGWVYTAPVGSFRPNPWGLYDMQGNVWQWTSDCWTESYAGAPPDGSAVTVGDCAKRVVRGGSWLNLPRVLRSADRNRFVAANRYYHSGFRLAKSLP
jgi:formylglycine-generating enzyme